MANNEKEILVRDNSDEFAASVCNVLENKEKAFQIGSNGRKLIEDKFSWESKVDKDGKNI